MKRALSLSVALVLVGAWSVATAEAQNRCAHSKDINETIDVSGAGLAHISARAGDLQIEGRAGQTDIRVEGRACAGREELLDDMSVRTERRGDTVEVEAEIPEIRSWSGSNYASIDLVITVPQSLMLEVDDSSGNMTLRNIAGANIDDSSDDIEVDQVAGDVSIDDSSGDIELNGVMGDVRIDDSSGDIDVRGGRSVVLEDSSGGIHVVDIEGSVLVESDSSGNITVERVGGDFTVRRDGSGSIRHTDVGGRVDVPSRGRRS